MPTRWNRWIFIADLIACSTCFGHHKAAAGKPDTQPSAPHHTDILKTKHQIRQAATTCITLSSSWWWALWCPKHVEQAIRSAIKIHQLHLVGILFPHIIDDARSKPHLKFTLNAFILYDICEITKLIFCISILFFHTKQIVSFACTQMKGQLYKANVNHPA